MDEHGNEHTLHPFTKLLWQRYFRPPRSYCQSATASTFSIFSRKGAKNSRFSCSTCPEAPATMSSPGSFFFNRKIIRRSGPPSQQIKSNQNQRVHASSRHGYTARGGGDGPGARGHKSPRRVLHHKLGSSLIARALRACVAGLYAPLARPPAGSPLLLLLLPPPPPPGLVAASEPYLLLRPSRPSWHWLVGVARQGG